MKPYRANSPPPGYRSREEILAERRAKKERAARSERAGFVVYVVVFLLWEAGIIGAAFRLHQPGLFGASALMVFHLLFVIDRNWHAVLSLALWPLWLIYMIFVQAPYRLYRWIWYGY